MIAVCTREEIRAADRNAILHEPIKSADLMERAALQFTLKLLHCYTNTDAFLVICGTGNNGGDGLCIARLLIAAGKKTTVVVTGTGEPTDDFLLNKKRYKGLIIDWETEWHLASERIAGAEVVIDAIIGTGVSKPVVGLLADLILHINSVAKNIVSIDVPSGVFTDGDQEQGDAIQANITIGFEFYKPFLFYPETAHYAGYYHQVSIGIGEQVSSNHPSYLVNAYSFYNSIPARELFSHKGTYGTLILYAGWKNLTGAALLSGKAALRCGAGKVNWVKDRETESHLSIVPELITSTHHEFALHKQKGVRAIVAGPGLGLGEEACTALKLVIQSWQGPLVLDADAITILAENRTWLSWLPLHTILTPHPVEFERLIGKRCHRKEAIEHAVAFAKKYRVYLLLKGHYSVLATPEGNTYYCGTGNPSLAKAGTGDVLTGIIGGLLTRGFNPCFSAAFGMTFHGFLADEWVKSNHEEALLASDLIDSMSAGWKHFLSANSVKSA